MADYIHSKGVDIHTSEEVRDIMVKRWAITGVVTKRQPIVPTMSSWPRAGWVPTGWRTGARSTSGLSQRGIEVGVRVEVHNDIMQDLCNVIYDPTFFIQTQKYDDQTRTFCTNQGGFVALESYKDFVCVNGHAYHDRKSTNTNFAFLSKVVLTEPVTDNQAYGESIGSWQLIGGGKPILQRFGDLKRGGAAPGTGLTKAISSRP